MDGAVVSRREVVLQLRDEVSRPLNELLRKLDVITGTGKKAKVDVDTDGAEKKLKKVKDAEKDIPSKKSTEVKADTDQALSRISKYHSRVKQVPKKWSTKLSANVSGFNNRIKSASSSLRNLRDEGTKLKGVFAGSFFGNLAANAVTGGLNAMKMGVMGVVGAGIEYNRQIQTMQATWTTLTGSAKEGQKMVDITTKMATAAQNSTEMVQDLNTKFYSVTNSASQTEKITKSMLTLQDAFGKSDAAVKGFATQYSQMLANGKVSGMDMMSIVNTFPKMRVELLKTVQEQTHNHKLTMSQMNDMISAGKVTSDMVNDTLFRMGHDYKDATANFAATFDGMTRTIKARIPVLMGEMTKPFMTATNPIYKSVSNWISDKKTDEVFNTAGKRVTTGMNAMLKGFSDIGGKGDFSDTANNLVLKFADKLEDSLKWIGNHADSLTKIVSSLGSISKDFTIGYIDALGSMFKLITGAKGDGIEAIADGLEKISKHETAIKVIGGIFATTFVAGKLLPVYTILKDIAGIKSGGFLGQLIKLGGNGKGLFGKLGKTASEAVEGTKVGKVSGIAGASKLGSLAKGIGKVAVPISLAFDAVGAISDLVKAFKGGSNKKKFSSVGESAGMIIGGGIGAFFGGPAGLAIGATIGKTAGKWAGTAAKDFTDGWNKKGRGVKPPTGIIPKAGYYTRAAGDAVTGWAKSFVKTASKHKKEILASLVNPALGVSAWFLKDTKTGKAVAKWATGFAKSVKSGKFADTVADQMDDARSHINDFGNKASKWLDSWSSRWSKGWRSHWSDAKNWMGDRLTDSRNTASDWGSSMSKWLGSFSGSFTKSWNSMWSGVGDFFHDIWKKLKGWAKEGINDVIGVINGGIGGIDKIINFFGGKKNVIKKIDKLAVGTKYHSGGPAIVNDQKGISDPRELIEEPDGSAYMYEGTDKFIPDLKAGSKVYTARETAQIMRNMSTPHFADGSDGLSDKFSQFIDGAMDIGSDFEKKLKQIADYVAHPVKAITKIFDQNAKFPSTGVGDFGQDGGHFMLKSGEKWFKGLFSSLKDGMDIGNPGGSGVTRWIPIIKAAASKMKVDLSGAGLKKILNTINHESGGSPTVMQHGYVDVNTGVDPAMGLLQFIGSTFRHYAMPGHTNRGSGYDQLLALFNDRNWFSDLKASGGWGPSGGRRFANGGHVTSPTMAMIGEELGEDEFVINPHRGNAAELTGQLLTRMHQLNPVSSSNNGGSGSISGLKDKLDAVLSVLREIADKSPEVNLDDLTTRINRRTSNNYRASRYQGGF